MSRHSLQVQQSRALAEERRALAAEIRSLSGGCVADIAPSGPVLARQPARQIRNAPAELFEAALSPRQQRFLDLMVVLWWSLIIVFGVWWFQPQHVGTTFGLVSNSIVVWFMLLIPAGYVFRMRGLRRVRRDLPLPDARVAMITTRAPSEPFSEVRPTLEAMLSQDTTFPYDVWLADEAPTDEILAWCTAHGVQVSTREGVEAYHRDEWPRRTRCKEGNLAYFYDTHGYDNYEIVAQFDCDHIPAPDYLEAILRPFSHPDVGYVAAPSMCDLNRAESWSGRGRLYAEAHIHGPFQLSHNGGLTPTCIGSHYAVRTSALARAGGLGPELAEDFSTSYVIRLTGADGVFAIDARAHGQGPPTFAAMVTQEFQWTRSLVVLFLGLVSRTLPVFHPRLRFRFSYALLFSSLVGVMAAAGFLIAPLAVVLDQQWMRMNFLMFLLLTFLVTLPLVGVTWIQRRAGLLRPNDVPLINWESGVFQLVRWPYLLQGALAGVRQVLTRKQVQFRVTPKGDTGLTPMSVKVIVPYVVLALVLTGIGGWGTVTDRALGYAGLTLLGAVTYGFLSFFIPWMHLRELPLGVGTRAERIAAVRTPLLLGVGVFLLSLAALALFVSVFFGGYQWIV
ncbi:glycosyltransferase family 2 protein [Corynebacterium nasicanis]|uniref:Glycosyltransferase family 2 protein n=1 Tax=Corynebacterium nasicanis TaxID=1448267 RepID=A0ABW1QGM9_9CORY